MVNFMLVWYKVASYENSDYAAAVAKSVAKSDVC
jgi:hypothetical protein